MHYLIRKLIKEPKNKIAKSIEDFDNKLGKSPLALRVVPLPNFTVSNIPDKNEYNLKAFILNIFWFIFLPRWYRIGRKDSNKLSSFSKMVLYENNDDIYDNPATEAVIDFRWQKARNFFFFLFIRFLIFAGSFTTVSVAYLDHDSEINIKLVIVSIVLFYYMAIYLFVTEIIQICYHGPRDYFGDIFNTFDVISIAQSVVVMTLMLKDFQFSNGFKSVESVNNEFVAAISFAYFFLWIELVLCYVCFTINSFT